MARILYAYGIPGNSADFYVFDQAGNVWNGSAYAAFASGSYATYRIQATETTGSGGTFTATMPSGADNPPVASAYRYELRDRSAVSYAASLLRYESLWTPPVNIVQVNGGPATPGVAATAAELAAAFAGQNITVLSTVIDGSIRIIRNNCYLSADSRALAFTVKAGSNWPSNLTGWTITFTARKTRNNDNEGDASITKAGSVTVATGPTQTVTLELQTTETATLAIGVGSKGYDFDIVAINGSDRATLVTGQMTVVDNVTP